MSVVRMPRPAEPADALHVPARRGRSGATADGAYPRRRLLGALGAVALSSTVPAVAQPRTAASFSPLQDSRALQVTLGQLGPQLVAAGVIDLARFADACARAGEPLDGLRRRALVQGSDSPMTIDASNAHFLLNFLWAVGLANANPILTQGPMVSNGLARVPGYASTGGWTLTSRAVMEIYARLPLITLTETQQARVNEAAAGIYRPCCDNPTSFPDCNHGMAMLGLLTLAAAEDRGLDALFLAAKAANRWWFAPQVEQVARYVQASRGIEYSRLDPRQAGGQALFSASGLRAVASWLSQRGLGAPARGGSCAA